MDIKSLIIYFICFGLSIIFAGMYQNFWKKNGFEEFTIFKKIYWYLLIITPPVLISSIRYDVGTDYFNYIYIYNLINSVSFDAAWANFGDELLYLIFNKIAYVIFQHEWGVFFLSSLTIHLFLVAALDFFKKDISMPFGLFIYYMYLFSFGLNGIRQAIAMAIVLYAIRFIYNRKLVSFILFIVVATLFHNTAIVCLAFYLMVSKKDGLIYFFKKYIYYIIILLTPLILLYMIKIFVNIPVFSGYAHYVSNQNLVIKFGFLLGIVPILIPVFIYKEKVLKRNKLYEPIINLSLLVIPFQYIGYYVDWGSRMALYIQILYLILIPLVIRSINNRFKKFFISFYFLIYFFVFYVINIVIKTYHGVYPYDSILF